MERTADSPLMRIGTMRSRLRLAGKSAKGDGEVYKVEVRGKDGRVTAAIVNDPAGVPPQGEFIAMPVLVGKKGVRRKEQPAVPIPRAARIGRVAPKYFPARYRKDPGGRRPTNRPAEDPGERGPWHTGGRGRFLCGA